jgi:hypothetical protein
MGYFCVLFVVVALIGACVAGYQLNARSEAKQAYLESLEKLKRDPQNPDLREQTLALGRAYALKGVPGFDEVALMNDINAACARTVNQVGAQEVAKKPSVEERLAKLDELRAKSLITEQEHQSRRKEILEEL